MVRVVIFGILGRMGKTIYELSKNFKDLKVVAGVDKKETSFEDTKVYTSLEDIQEDFDVIIDFSLPEGTEKVLKYLEKNPSKKAVIGTTSLSKEIIEKIKKISQKTAICYSPNMSLGVNLLFKLVEIAANLLKNKGFDIEILEIHHRFKKDAPSGTAMKLYEIINSIYDNSLKRISCRDGLIGERKENEVGVMALRGGNVAGEHTIYFFGEDERLELTHKANSRKPFAKGALFAAKFIKEKDKGLFNMFDVLGI
ncbi:MAG TPA: 4-hydroxy-tetrahydrodipicolinate reductase [Desulfurobacteriaceae bacterium]|nr:4-hydroxy-tetrahydrodipicolinate reductase [Desulfurobacteriaceae bacterium]